MQRREFLSIALCSTVTARGQSVRKPNIVVILADDLGYGDLGCYGSRTNQTPHLDRMAQEGIRFTDFTTPMPFCAPTRAALLTGRYPFRNNMSHNPAPDSGINGVGLPAGEITLAEALEPHGYRSICIGKWHLGHTREFLPRTQGFDEYYGILYSNDMRPVQMVHNEEVVQYPVVQGNLTKDYTDRALRFMEQNRERPFLLYLPHAMPHKPLAASEAFYTPETRDLYANVIRELDWSVGQILKRIQDLGLDRDTIVLFTSDNGPWYGGSTGRLRGMKARTWEGGLRVPLIARWPGRIPAAQVCRQMAGTIDLFPTLCGLASAATPQDRVIDGKDILPLLTTPGAKSPHEALFAMGGPELKVVRSGPWKLHVKNPGSSSALDVRGDDWIDPRGPDGLTIIAQAEQAMPSKHPGLESGAPPKPMMLFDVVEDPGEQHDVAAKHPEVVARLKALFDEMEAQVPPIAPAVITPGPRGIRRLPGGALQYELPLRSRP
jgi:uncharacterized sulfatase